MTNFGLHSQNAKPITLRNVNANVRIEGFLAHTTLTQRYHNDSDTNLELTYTFPAAVDAALMAFSVRIGEKLYQGVVIPRQEAESSYEEAISDGNQAFRIQELKPGIYCATLGNVMPGDVIEIGLEVAETLKWNGNSIRYRLPCTIAPRYGEPVGFSPWQKPETQPNAEYSLALEAVIGGSLARASIACPSHNASFRQSEDGLHITLASGATMDRDFILEIDCKDLQSLGGIASALDTHIATVTLLAPQLETETPSGRDVVIVLDCSGSMAGNSLKLAKGGVQLALSSLGPNEHFGLIGFGNRCQHFSEGLQPASRGNIERAHNFVDQLTDMGGTELIKALNEAIGYAHDAPMDILLLTDGETWRTDEITSIAKERGIRIFTIGIGSAVAEDTVLALANLTGGACELVSPNEEMSARIYRHFLRMRQPRIAPPHVHWPATPLWESHPSKPCFAGDSYTIFAAFAEPIDQTVEVTLQYADFPAIKLAITMQEGAETAHSLVRLAANQRLANLPAAEKEAWAVRYQLMSKESDYLVTAEQLHGAKAAALPELQTIPQMLPAGWGNTSSVAKPVAVYCRPSFRIATTESAYGPPAALRKRTKTGHESSYSRSSPLMEFFDALNSDASRTFFGKLAACKKELRCLPTEIGDAFDQILAHGAQEQITLAALFQALLNHEGRSCLKKAFVKRALKVIQKLNPGTDLVGRFEEVLSRLWVESKDTFTPVKKAFDIPEFLRKQAD